MCPRIQHRELALPAKTFLRHGVVFYLYRRMQTALCTEFEKKVRERHIETDMQKSRQSELFA